MLISARVMVMDDSNRTEVRVRADLRLAPAVSGGQQPEELLAFAGFCAARIARGIAGVTAWDLYLVAGLDGHADAVVRAHVDHRAIEARASACDPAHAIWNAMCDLEQPLRDAAARAA